MLAPKFDLISKIKGVERDWKLARLALNRLQMQADQDPTLLPQHLRNRDVTAAVERLDGTYLIRLFAVFETGLRSYYKSIKPKRPPTKVLLNTIGSRCHIADDTIQQAQSVRIFRNQLVHERDEDIEAIPLADARGHLCTFLSFLPIEWGV